MQVYVVHIFSADPRIFHGQADRARRFFATLHQSHPMISFASRSVAAHFRQDFRSPRLRMFVFFEHKHPTAFAQHESITVGRKWTRAFFWRTVPILGENLHQDESLYGTE